MVIRSKLLEEIRAESLIDIIPGMDLLLLQHGQYWQRQEFPGAPINKYLMPVSSSLKIAQQEYSLAESPTGYIQKYRSVALRESCCKARLTLTQSFVSKKPISLSKTSFSLTWPSTQKLNGISNLSQLARGVAHLKSSWRSRPYP